MAARGCNLGCKLQKIASVHLRSSTSSRQNVCFYRTLHHTPTGHKSAPVQKLSKQLLQTRPSCASSSPWSGETRRLYSLTSEDIDVTGTQKTEDEVKGAFDLFGISPETQQKLRAKGIEYLFPVQYHTFTPTFNGIDVVVQARTGTGKTLSFGLPLVEKLQRDVQRIRIPGRKPLALVLAPTRELANQVRSDLQDLCSRARVICVYGGVSQMQQEREIRSGADIVVGTPGRVKDLIQQNILSLDELQHFILDEVDKMLDMGFAEQVEDIVQENYQRGANPQTMMYSATMPSWAQKIARKYLSDDYKMVKLIGRHEEQTATTIKQYKMQCNPQQQAMLIEELIRIYSNNGPVIIFCNRKQSCNVLSSKLRGVKSRALHGDIGQNARNVIMKDFKEGIFNVLITTDVSARGLDIPNVSMVIQDEPPQNTEYYIHRVGRTGRAGKSGMSVLLYSQEDAYNVRTCEQEARTTLTELPMPTHDEMLESWVKLANKRVKKCSKKTASYFQEAAEELMREMGPIEALSATMALISGADKYVARSLITLQPGYVTLCYKSNDYISGIHAAKTILNSFLVAQNISPYNIQMLKDHTGVVFDVPEANVDILLKEFSDIRTSEDATLEQPRVLPNLVQSHRMDSSWGEDNRGPSHRHRDNRFQNKRSHSHDNYFPRKHSSRSYDRIQKSFSDFYGKPSKNNRDEFEESDRKPERNDYFQYIDDRPSRHQRSSRSFDRGSDRQKNSSRRKYEYEGDIDF